MDGHIACVEMCPELLCQLLCLPEGTQVIDAGFIEGGVLYPRIKLVLEHPDLEEVKPGEEIPKAKPMWSRQGGVAVFEGWGQ